MGAVGRGDYGRATAAMAVMRVVGQMASMGSVAMVFALWLGPVRITRAVYPALGNAIAICFTLGAILCTLGIILSLTRGRMHVSLLDKPD